MPKILINEKDLTTPGTPGSYDNYAVLIAGFSTKSLNNSDSGTITADENHAYEFRSAQTFIDTIGLVPPTLTLNLSDGSGSRQLKHYGNQMAYELLKSGYPIIYRSLGSMDDYDYFEDVIEELLSEDMWKPFKDKASYDFRFVSHGLLESSELPADVATYYQDLKDRLADINEAFKLLTQIDDEVESEYANRPTTPNMEAEKAEEKTARYFEVARANSDNTAFISDVAGNIYGNFDDAMAGITAKKNDAEDNFNSIKYSYLTTSGINTVNANIANLAKYTPIDNPNNQTVFGRGDCIALIELDERLYSTSRGSDNAINNIIKGISEMSDINADNGKYCALTVPSVTYKMADNTAFNNNKTFPGAFHYLVCFINSLKLGFAEWYAAAGYTRGVSSYTIDSTTVKLGEIAINALEPRNIVEASDPKFACNVIANFRGSYYLWGNRTAHPLGKRGSLETGDLVASSFLNIRQLCTTIKKQLYVACRTFTFDPNSDTLWVNFVNAIRPTLDAMKSDQGIRDYRILKVFTDTKATLKAKIRIIPIEAVEDFDLEVSLEDSFGETAATVTE